MLLTRKCEQGLFLQRTSHAGKSVDTKELRYRQETEDSYSGQSREVFSFSWRRWLSSYLWGTEIIGCCCISLAEEQDGSQIEIRFTLKVEYLGQSAHSIAFVKRDGFQVLELKSGSTDNVKHLSSQLQVMNLGFVGEDANIFELAVNYVEYSFIPLFNTYKTAPSSSGTDDKAGAAKKSSL